MTRLVLSSRSSVWSFLSLSLLIFTAMRVAAQTTSTVKIPVDSPAVRFSPANWSGDTGRGGSGYRQSWLPGAWVKFYWSDTSATPTAQLLISNQTSAPISYYCDGSFTDNVPATPSGQITVQGLSGTGAHELDVYLRTSVQSNRWSLGNCWRVSGLVLDTTAIPAAAPPLRPWVLEIGDSITEGSAANNGDSDNLADYSFLTGQALNVAGYDYAVSACGYSGYMRPGDGNGDVPPYYNIANGVYDEKNSRWDKIDSNTSLLSGDGEISAYGAPNTAPAMITINYGTNEAFNPGTFSDLPASVLGTLTALRRAAPNAWVLVYVPFNLYSPQIYSHGQQVIDILKTAVKSYRANNPHDFRTVLVDYGPVLSQDLVTAGGGEVHPNLIGHVTIATHTIATVLSVLVRHSSR